MGASERELAGHASPDESNLAVRPEAAGEKRRALYSEAVTEERVAVRSVKLSASQRKITADPSAQAGDPAASTQASEVETPGDLKAVRLYSVRADSLGDKIAAVNGALDSRFRKIEPGRGASVSQRQGTVYDQA
jgi:hypothetical protein